MEPTPIRVLIVEANQAYAETLREIVSSVPRLEVMGVAATADEALVEIERARPDIVITDVQPAGSTSGFAFMWRTTENYDSDMVGLLGIDDDAYREGAFKHGACACLLKECVAEELPAVLRSLSERRPPRE